MFDIWRDAPIAVGSPGFSSAGCASRGLTWLAGLDRPAVRRLGSPVIHTPEKSGLPSAILGGGADILTLPSGLRGTPSMGGLNH
jgi:hypothetical protein